LPKTEPDHDLDLTFGETVRLTGYDLTAATLMPGQSLQVVLYWEPLQSMAEDWTTFVQVLNAEGAKLGQSDHRPGGDFHPTGLWLPGERLADKHIISLPSELGPGPYRLVAGFYLYPSEPLRHLGEPQTIAEIIAAR